METPSSTRRLTRSQTASLLNSASKLSKGGDGCLRSRSHRADRLALLDITNDSPIAGVTTIAGENKTPASRMKTVPRAAGLGDTPCSGETLLRCQVKSLLQRVEEESEFPKLETHCLQQQTLCLVRKGLISPAGLLAPTPVNTPEIFGNPQLENKSVSKGEVDLSFFASVGEAFHLPELKVLDGLQVEKEKPTESPITRALTFDSPEKSETPASVSATTIITPSLDFSYQANSTQQKAPDDDNASEWSIRVNVCSPRSTVVDEDEDEFGEAEDKDDADDEEDEFEECNEIDDDLCDELSRELSKICVQETEEEGLPRFTGTHTRFRYNSDDEIEEEVVVGASSNVLHLKGLPNPKGKHLRFPDEEERTP